MLLKFVKRRRTSSSWEGVLASWGPWGTLLGEVGTSTPVQRKKVSTSAELRFANPHGLEEDGAGSQRCLGQRKPR